MPTIKWNFKNVDGSKTTEFVFQQSRPNFGNSKRYSKRIYNVITVNGEGDNIVVDAMETSITEPALSPQNIIDQPRP